MNKTSLKIFICFTCTAAVIATILLTVNFVGIACIIGSDASINLYDNSPQKTLRLISENLTQNGSGFVLSDDVLPDEFWCILIDETGEVIWSENMPTDIPKHYSINDIARMTHWYLNDYPVYVRTEDYGLIVLGIPKNAVGKYEMTYSMKWFDTLPQRILAVLVINLCFAAILAFVFGIRLYRRLRVLMNGISDLQQEKRVRLKEKGIFKEISASINHASDTIERKNAALAARDHARTNWISGISHDIRTPLAIVMGNAEELESAAELSDENKKRAGAILLQSIKVKKLIEDLNLISALEYDMQPGRKKPVRLCPFLRRIVSNVINSGISDAYEIELDLQDEKATVLADEFLLERAIFNLINNSITHNKNGCKIRISTYTSGQSAHIVTSDNGSGVSDAVLEKISEMPKSAHGIGLPMAYKIISVHGGKMTVANENGFVVKIEMPINNN